VANFGLVWLTVRRAAGAVLWSSHCTINEQAWRR